MAAGRTYTPLATTTLPSSATDYTFNSISSAYTDLVLVFSGTQTSAGNTLYVRFNGDTASNYSYQLLYASGASRNATTQILMGGNNSGISGQCMAIVRVQNYASTSSYKSMFSRYGCGSTEQNSVVGTWRSTAAINSITVRIDANSIAAGTMMTLYGIKAA